ncbi:hypothetical protein BDF19DRAFT_311420 [Syncephalis fuscata]|nr:hypothetical protein BDF19DRAFT_311420 [Syncephalis fuscata]
MERLHWTVSPCPQRIRKDTNYIKSILISLRNYYQSINSHLKSIYASFVQRMVTVISKHGAVFLTDPTTHQIHLNELLFFSQAEFKVSLTDRWSVVQRIRHLPPGQSSIFTAILQDRFLSYIHLEPDGYVSITGKSILISALRNTLIDDEKKYQMYSMVSFHCRFTYSMLKQCYCHSSIELAGIMNVSSDILSTLPVDWISIKDKQGTALDDYCLEAIYSVQLTIYTIVHLMQNRSDTWLWVNTLDFINNWIETHQAMLIQYDMTDQRCFLLITIGCKIIHFIMEQVNSPSSLNSISLSSSDWLVNELIELERLSWQQWRCTRYDPPSSFVIDSSRTSLNLIDPLLMQTRIHQSIHRLYLLGQRWDRSITLPSTIHLSNTIRPLDCLFSTPSLL